MIPKIREKIKPWLIEHRSDVFVALLILLTSITSFGLGRLSVLWPHKTPVTIAEPPPLSGGGDRPLSAVGGARKEVPAIKTKGKFVASKNGKSYHLPWCSGASLIKEENKVWFETKEAAEKAGYTPAGNCPGL